jgi:hypothetical protein
MKPQRNDGICLDCLVLSHAPDTETGLAPGRRMQARDVGSSEENPGRGVSAAVVRPFEWRRVGLDQLTGRPLLP